MKISTRGRYALRMMVELCRRREDGFLPLRDIAKDIWVDAKYLEQIAAALSKAGLVQVARGSSGGYRLSRLPEEYTALEILEAAEGSMAPVACLEHSPDGCVHSADCPALPFWEDFYGEITRFLRGRTLSDIAAGRGAGAL